MITQFTVKENEIVYVCVHVCTPYLIVATESYFIRTLHYRINQTSFQCSMNTIKNLFCFPCGMMCRLVYTEGAHVGLCTLKVHM
jgi:hypothetical protein